MSDTQLIKFWDINGKLNSISIKITRRTTTLFDAELFDVDISRDPELYDQMHSATVSGKPTALEAFVGTLAYLNSTQYFPSLNQVDFQIVNDMITLTDFELELNKNKIKANVIEI